MDPSIVVLVLKDLTQQVAEAEARQIHQYLHQGDLANQQGKEE